MALSNPFITAKGYYSPCSQPTVTKEMVLDLIGVIQMTRIQHLENGF